MILGGSRIDFWSVFKRTYTTLPICWQIETRNVKIRIKIAPTLRITKVSQKSSNKRMYKGKKWNVVERQERKRSKIMQRPYFTVTQAACDGPNKDQ